MARTATYRLPWPPSVNTYWRKGGNVTYLTKKAREFRKNVCQLVKESENNSVIVLALDGRLAVNIELTLPDRRRRDIDNHVKGVLDSLQHAGVFEDDEQIDELRVKRLHVEPPGCCDVTVTEIEA